MSYIGKEPADSFISFAKQDFSTSATTSYTLDNAVTNENELALFINFVRQEPTTAYTASGTTLTLTSATASSDDMYCIYLGKAVQTVNPPSGSVGSSQVAASIITGQTAETSIATDDTVLIHDTSAGALRKMTRANFVSGVGGANTPAFEAYLGGSGGQSLSNDTVTKIQFNTEVFDSDGTYDNSSNYRFTVPSGKGGKYFITAQVNLKCNSGNNLQTTFIALYINGSAVNTHHKNDSAFNTSNLSRRDTRFISTILDLSAGDYVEVYAQLGDNSHDIGGSGIQANNAKASSFFAGYRIGA